MGDLAEVLQEAIFPEMVGRFLGSGISESVVTGSIVVGIIALFALIVRIFVIPRFKEVPGGFQIFLEWIVTAFDGSAKNTVGKFSNFLGPYTFGAAAYICIGVLVELVGLRPVVSDINACLGLSILTFILINIYGVKAKGPVGRVKYYFKPMWYIAPIKMITDLAVPVSMALRLFASVLSGLLVMDLLYAVVENFMYAAFGVPAILSVVFTLFHAFMQSYIFATLSLAFISEATE